MGVAFTGDRGEPVVASAGNLPTFGADLTTISEFFAERSLRRFTTLTGLQASTGVTPGDLAAADDTPELLYQWDGSDWVALRLAPADSYSYVATVRITATQDFLKASYPWLRMIEATGVGCGGGSGGCASTAAGQIAASGGGGGGATAKKRITDIAGMPTTVTATIGAAGTAGASGNNNGGDGGDVTFGTYLTAKGGKGGAGSAGATGVANSGGDGGPVAGSVGDVIIPGEAGGNGLGTGGATTFSRGSNTGGGNSIYPTNRDTASGPNVSAVAGTGRGVGATGGRSEASQSAKAGAAGSAGELELRLYA